jgi:L-2-hydroxycarboxylate dehydrogenase (NAD+)
LDVMSVTVSVEAARTVAARALIAAGADASAAKIQADMLIEGELRGRRSHGLQRLKVLTERLKAGLAQTRLQPILTWMSPSLLKVDGLHGLGPVVCDEVLRHLISRTQETGIAAATISNTNHLGMLAPYVEQVAEVGLLAIALTTSEALVHPWGGREALIGTNPIAIGIPAKPIPVVIDLATSQISVGQAINHLRAGEELPSGSALDAHGNQTNDPQLAIHGALSPFGGAKGYALGLGIELIVAALTGTATGKDVRGTLDASSPSTKGDVIIVLDPARTNPCWSDDSISSYLRTIRNSPPAPGSSGVWIPGDGSRRSRDSALQSGLKLSSELWDLICSLADTQHKTSIHPKRQT